MASTTGEDETARSVRNEALVALRGLEGQWALTLSDAWFLEPRDTVLHGAATVSWLGDAFLRMVAEIDGHQAWDLVIGRSDPQQRYVLLYADDRGVGRVFDMTYADGRWEWSRSDPDFWQRFVSTVQPDRIEGRAEASEDRGVTWRKDFDLVFTRV